jgi:aminoglycoside phosphotransferase family enzyme
MSDRQSSAGLAFLRAALPGAVWIETSRAAELIERHAEEIAARSAARLIVDGHGNLRPEHVRLTDPPVIFDRLEFDLGMRMIDIFDETGLRGLECAMRGAEWIGPALRQACRPPMACSAA